MHPRLNVPIGRLVYRGMVLSKRPKRDTNGEPVFRRMLNGEPINQVNVPEVGTIERIFHLESDGHGNIYKIECPRPEVIRASMDEQARKQAAKDFVPELAEALLASGLTKDEILKRLLAEGKAEKVETAELPEPEAVAKLTEPEVAYPIMVSEADGKQVWRFSNKETIQLPEAEAREYELMIQESRQERATVGAF